MGLRGGAYKRGGGGGVYNRNFTVAYLTTHGLGREGWLIVTVLWTQISHEAPHESNAQQLSLDHTLGFIQRLESWEHLVLYN